MTHLLWVTDKTRHFILNVLWNYENVTWIRMWSKPYLMYLWCGTHGVSHQNGCLVVTALNCAHGLLYCAHGLLYCAHGLLYCAHGLLYRAHGLLYRAHGLLYCAHRLLYCAHGLLYRAHGLLYCAHGLLYCAHRLFFKITMSPPGLRIISFQK